MRKGTTPTHTFELPFSTELVAEVKVTYAQGKTEILSKETTDCVLDG